MINTKDITPKITNIATPKKSTPYLSERKAVATKPDKDSKDNTQIILFFIVVFLLPNDSFLKPTCQ